MLNKIKLTALLFICAIFTGCSSAKTVAIEEHYLSTLTPTLAKIALTPTPTCVDEPDLILRAIEIATIDLLNTPIKFDRGADYSTELKDDIQFYIRGIYSINKDIAFVFGGLEVSTGARVSSLLFRTSDGGKHWKEVMPRINFNDITHVVFIGNGDGWAIATWTLEGELGTKLWHTIDYGETWQESKGHPPVNSIDGIRIFDNKHLQIKSLFWWANPNADAYQIWDSYNGGTNWVKSFSIPVNEKNFEAVIEAYADSPGGIYGNYYDCIMWRNTCNTYGQDGSKWQVQNVSRKRCINHTMLYDKLQYAEIRRKWLDQETAFALPVYFYYQENKLYVKP